MHYSKKLCKKKVKELESNKNFIAYAKNSYEEAKSDGVASRYNTFEEYLEGEVFTLYDNFSILEFLQNADEKTKSRVMTEALKGL